MERCKGFRIAGIFVVLAILTMALPCREASAQTGALVQYCTSNPYFAPPTPPPGYTSGCFVSYAEAEEFMKREPDPAVGRSLLEPKEQSPLLSGLNVTVSYYVPPRAPDEHAGDTYSTQWISDEGCCVMACPAPALPFISGGGCVDQPSLEALILTSWSVGPDTCLQFFGTYLDAPNTWSSYQPVGGYQAWGDRGLVAGNMAPPTNFPTQPAPQYVEYHCEDPPPPGPRTQVYWTASKTGWFWCPTHFQGNGGTDPSSWPTTCRNGQTGGIVTRLLQSESCGVGNPCIPASGAKVQAEDDLSWGRLHFTRTYDSLQQLVGNSQMGPAWIHSLDAHAWLQANTNLVFLRDRNGQFEKYTRVGTDRYAASNIVGKVLDRQPSSTMARWVLTEKPGEQWVFDSNGVLQAIQYADAPADNLALSYCDAAGVSASTCAIKGTLIAVTDGRGRRLTFVYQPALSIPDYVPPRLLGIEDDTGPRVSYQYDSLGRLSQAIYNEGSASQTSRTYLYGEAANLCNDGNGNATLPCPTVGFPNLLTGMVDESGNRFLDVTYDNHGRATSSRHPAGADKVVLAYTTASAQVTMPDGELRTYAYGNQLFPRLGDYTVSGSGLTFASHRLYDGSDRLSQLTDARGTVTKYGYDSYHETSRIEAFGKPEQRTRQTDWDTVTNRVSAMRTYAGSTLEVQTSLIYNSRGQTTARCQIDPNVSGATSYACGSATNAPAGVRQSRMTYCEQADVTAGTCPLVGMLVSTNGARLTGDTGMGGVDDTTLFTYYPSDDPGCSLLGGRAKSVIENCNYRRGDLWKVTNALGHVTEYVAYDQNGRIKRVKDANGTYTDMAYYPRGWLADRVVRANAVGSPGAGDATMHIDYDAVGNVSKVTQPDGVYLAYTYDDAHRLIKITDNLSNAIDYCSGGVGTADCLDAAGNRKVEQVKDSGGNIKRSLRRAYNQLSQLTQVLNAASQAVEHSNGLNSTGVADGYDGNGNRVLSQDGLGFTTEQDYDPLNRLKTTIQNVGGTDPATQNTTTGYAYDTRDNLRQVTDPDLLSTTYDYDGLNNLTGLHSPDTGLTTYLPDAAGNRVSQTDNRNVTSTYTYDALNRLAAISYPTASSLNVGYAYDQSNATTGCATSYPLGHLTRMTDASGTTTYCYDRRGNVVQKTQNTGGMVLVTQSTYTVADRLATMTYPSGAIVTYARDALGRVQSISWKANATATAITLINNATYYPFGPLSNFSFGNGRTQSRSYDQDYAIDLISGTPAGALTLDLGVDVMGNITKASGTFNPATPDRGYVYDPLYRLITAQTGATPPGPLEAYTYDKTGDRLSAALNGGAAQTYTYTPLTHHLASVGGTARTYDLNGNTQTGTAAGLTLGYDARNRLATMVQGATSATYVMNGRGERVQKTVTVQQGRFFTATLTFYTYNESGQLLNGDDSEYVYLDSIPVAVVRAGVPYYIEADHLGTPRQVIDATRNVAVWKWDSLASTFGTNAPNQDPDGDSTQFMMNLRFPGQYYDAETGLNYNYFRDYESGTGRYVESDPIGIYGGFATYGYAGQNSLASFDKYGLCWSNARAVAHFYTGGGASVNTDQIGCTSQIEQRIDPARNAWISKMKAEAASKAAGMRCGTSMRFSASRSVGISSGIFWIGGFSLLQKSDCVVSRSCGSNGGTTCAADTYNFDCLLTHIMHDLFVNPSDFDNSGDDFWDKLNYGGAPFYVDGFWDDRINGGGVLL